MKVIITGVTGMVGEGVMLECLESSHVTEVLLVSRRSFDFKHPKVKELLVADFNQLNNYKDQIENYDACFYCAGVSSVGMDEEKFNAIIHDTTLNFAKVLLEVNPNSSFIFVTGAGTDSSETGKLMWARVKGKTENALMKLGFKKQFNFRPGAILPHSNQKNWKWYYKFIVKIMQVFAPKSILTIHEIGLAMIQVSKNGYSSKIMEIKDIKSASKL